MTAVAILRIAGVATVGVAWLIGLWAVGAWRRRRSTVEPAGGVDVLERAMVPCRPDRYRGTRRRPQQPTTPAVMRGVARVPAPVSPRGTWPLVPLRTDPRRDTVQVQVYDPPTWRRPS